MKYFNWFPNKFVIKVNNPRYVWSRVKDANELWIAINLRLFTREILLNISKALEQSRQGDQNISPQRRCELWTAPLNLCNNWVEKPVSTKNATWTDFAIPISTATWLCFASVYLPSQLKISQNMFLILVNPSGQAVKIKRAIIFLSFAFYLPTEKSFSSPRVAPPLISGLPIIFLFIWN